MGNDVMGRSRGLRWRALTLGPAVLLVSCAPLPVQTDYDPQIAFGEMRTYSWIDSVDTKQERDASPFLARRLRRAVDRVLGERGFEPADGAADFLVTAFVVDGPAPRGRWAVAPRCGPVITLRIGFTYPIGLSFRRPWYPFRSPYWRSPWGYACAYRIGVGHIWVPIYEEPGGRLPGTVVIDVLDAGTRELIWRGWAEGALWDGGGWNADQEEVDAIVARVMADFPPPPVGR